MKNIPKYLFRIFFILTLCFFFIGCFGYKKKVYAPETVSSAQSSTKTDTILPVTNNHNTNDTPSQEVTIAPDYNDNYETASETGIPLPAATQKTTSITISAAGDCTFGSDQSSPVSVNFYSVYNKKKNNAYFFKNVKKYFKDDDLTLVNLEGTLTTGTTRVDKTFAFKGSPSYVNILKKGSVEMVSFANNHCSDYGQQSYTDTIATVKKADIKLASYGKVCIYKTKGKRIGMVAVNGLLGVDYSKNLIDAGIKKLKKKKADLIIVSMHAGVEHTDVLNDVQKTLSHYAVNKGANLVLGHHPHVLQGIEKYKGVYIVYSLGNFCFGGNTNPSDKDTMIFQQTFTFKKDKLKKTDNIRIIPCRISSATTINNYQPTPLKGAGKRRVIARVNNYSKVFDIKFNKKGILITKK